MRASGVVAAAAVVVCAAGAPALSLAPAPTRAAPAVDPHVVVATLDTGGNPMHPTWRRKQQRHPSAFIPEYPRSARAARLSLGSDFATDMDRSEAAIEMLQEGGLHWIPGTNIIGTWSHPTDGNPIFDATGNASHAHGAQASSQIAGRGHGLAPDAWLVIMDRTADGGANTYEANAAGLRWAADQPWIDIIHTNIQDPQPLADESRPALRNYPDAVAYAISKGKIVVSAGGNFYAEPTETSPHAGPRGVLVAGANDNCSYPSYSHGGYTSYSNPDPHVVMDGVGTVSAAPNGYGQATFSGTSSASPRITGYVANLLLNLRREYGYRGGITKDGALLTVSPARRPAKGPLADGRLTAAELHEVVRRTADPKSHPSKWDGTAGACVPGVPDARANYLKVGYGEVSEHTDDAALGVLKGKRPMPARPNEDEMYARSEELRELFWG